MFPNFQAAVRLESVFALDIVSGLERLCVN